MILRIVVLLFLLFAVAGARVRASTADSCLSVVVRFPEGTLIPTAFVDVGVGREPIRPDRRGRIRLCDIDTGRTLLVGADGCDPLVVALRTLPVDDSRTVTITLRRRDRMAEPVVVTGDSLSGGVVSYLGDVTATAIYAGKKTERIDLASITANTATNNPRQIYASVAGLNIWESDGAGIQLGIGGRGLSPNRTSNFTTRQNSYDISADPLGYPESYYTPPAEALERIELVRGAGSLRYGTQFGGMINFVMREGARDEAFSGIARISAGTYGFAGLFTQVGGTVGDVNYTALYQGRRGDGWRPNAGFDMHMGYASVRADVAPGLRIRGEYTVMSYLAQQPGGLTDRQFSLDPSQSLRARNWFAVDWNLAALTVDYVASDRTVVRSQFFGMVSGRQALGNLERINVADLGRERTLIDGVFRNVGNESTVIHDVDLFGQRSTVLVGTRLFHGTTSQRQGNGSAGADADFRFLRPDDLEGSDFRFPNDNAALFAEAVLRLPGGFALIPGARLEHITTRSEGYYKQRVTDFAGNVIVDTNIAETRSRSRTIGLLGLGMTYRLDPSCELYGNLAQNYRSITFSDLRIDNPNLIVDSAITDERGYTADIGIRGYLADIVRFDASLFYLRYDDRIGQVLRADQAPLYLPYRYRTNIADAYTAGLEAVVDLSLVPLFTDAPVPLDLHLLLNGSVLRGAYIDTDDASVRGRAVELVPPHTVRIGLQGAWKAIRASLLVSSVGEHFTDATNAVQTATAVNGVIPAYTVVDVSVRVQIDAIGIELSCNNVLDARYFTRRADAYPGPGIIPSDIRTATMSVQYRW